MPLAGFCAPDHDDHRIAQDVVGQLADLGRHGRREHERLPLDRQRVEDAADVGQEAHVEHPVGLVEHEHLERRVVDVAEAHVVEEPSGRRDDDLRAGAQRALLRAHVDAAHDGHRREPDVVAERQRLLVDLQRQLARRREDERAELAVRRPAVQALQDRQEERRRLAGAGGRAADQVAAGQDHRDRLRLDRRRPGVPHVPDGLGQRRDEVELAAGGSSGGHGGEGRRHRRRYVAQIDAPRSSGGSRAEPCVSRRLPTERFARGNPPGPA